MKSYSQTICKTACSILFCWKEAFLILSILCCDVLPADNPVTAFPGAEGFGMYSAGGRGGKIIIVSSLADSGPGSLRAAVELSFI